MFLLFKGGSQMNDTGNEFQQLNTGETVTGTVVKVEDKHVLVDINYKTEGIVPISELSSLHIEKAGDVVKEGDEITLKIKKMQDDEIVLSKKAVDADKAWRDLEEKMNNNETFETTVKEIVKGGLVVDVGIRGFIPASLVETYYVKDFSDYLDRSLTVKVVELDKAKNRVILSHRAVIEAEKTTKKHELLNSLEEGQVIEGVVQRITNFGVFVDLGGIDGLVHVSQLAHEHVENASDVVSEGEKITVEVLSVDRDNERIALSRKNVIPGPWEGVEKRVKIGQTLEGTVKRLVSFGAFVEVLPGVEGLVHISQIANRHIGTPQEVLEVGQVVSVKVLDVDEKQERMSLSIKEVEQDQDEKEYKQYEKDADQGGFQFGDIIGEKLNKYRS